MSEYTYEVNRIAEQVQREIDQAAADKVADKLEQLGYVKVVRCRDCRYCQEPQLMNGWNAICVNSMRNVVPDGFCAWASKRK